MPRPITTKRLTLRPIETSDVAAIVTLIGDLEVSRWLTLVPHPYSKKDAETFIADIPVTGRFWALSIDGPLIGVISIKSELGYWLGKPYWGKGLMTEAARAVVGNHFSLFSETISSGFHIGNQASEAVLRKLGFMPTEHRTAFCHSLKRDVTIQGMALDQDSWQTRA